MLNQDEVDLFVANEEKLKFVWIWNVKLKFELGFMFRVSWYCFHPWDALDLKPGYTYSFGDDLVQLMFESRVIGISVFNGGLYR